MFEIKQFSFNIFGENTIVAWKDRTAAVIVDPGCYDESERAALTDFLSSEGITPAAIILTHAHPDHIFGVRFLQEKYNIPVYMHPDDVPVLDYSEKLSSKLGLTPPDISFPFEPVKEGETVGICGFNFEIIHTPGHTPGGVCYYDRTEGMIFTGDTLFAGTIGRSDLMMGDYDKLIISVMDKLMLLDAAVEVYPGHGGKTTIGYERMNNPFLEPFNEPESTGSDPR